MSFHRFWGWFIAAFWFCSFCLSVLPHPYFPLLLLSEFLWNIPVFIISSPDTIRNIPNRLAPHILHLTCEPVSISNHPIGVHSEVTSTILFLVVFASAAHCCLQHASVWAILHHNPELWALSPPFCSNNKHSPNINLFVFSALCYCSFIC